MTAERCDDDIDDVFVRGAIFLSYVLADERLELCDDANPNPHKDTGIERKRNREEKVYL